MITEIKLEMSHVLISMLFNVEVSGLNGFFNLRWCLLRFILMRVRRFE